MSAAVPGRVSVIMPCFNAAQTIADSIASVLAQGYPDIELIVINDGSSDDSEAVVKSFAAPGIRYISQANAGVSAARNCGIAEARGEYIAFLDADDTWERDLVEKLVGALVSKPECVLAYCGWQNLGKPGPQSDPFVPPDYEGPDKLARLFADCRWPIHAVLIRAAEVRRAGGFDPRLRNAEDFLLWLRIAAFQPICRVPEVLAYYHHHGQAQASQNHVQAALDHWRAQRLYLAGRPEVKARLGRQTIRRLTLGRILKKGYELYWQREMEGARALFRVVMRHGYGRPKDWLYMLPCWLPLPVHRRLID